MARVSGRMPARLGAAAALVVAAVSVALGIGGREDHEITIRNPYEGSRGEWLRGQTHAHSTVHRFFCSADSLRDKVERYRDAGYDFICMTDHNFRLAFDTTYAVLPTRDPRVEGIHFISGAEVGFTVASPYDVAGGRKHHLGGVGMDWTVAQGDTLFDLVETDTSTTQAAIDSIRTMRYAEDREALAVINHPEMQARFDVRFYPSELASLRGYAGIEIYNTKWAEPRPTSKTWQNHGVAHWDFILGHGEDRAWGFATDDAHSYEFGLDYLGGWILVHAEQRTTVSILDAVRAGQFFACVDSCASARRDTVSAAITSIGVTGRDIRVASDRPSEFTWWTDYGHVSRTVTNASEDTYRVEGWESYVRLRIRNENGAIYTQPFRVENPQRDAEHGRLRREEGTRLLLHFDEGYGDVVEDASGRGHALRLQRPWIPPLDEWRTLADTTAYRDSLWSGWVHNSVGTAPDETDIDRDGSGYAIRAHGRSVRGGVTIPEWSAWVGDSFTLEWIGAVTERRAAPQPLFVEERNDGENGRVAWRVEVTEETSPAPYRVQWVVDGIAPPERTFHFGEGLEVGATDLIALEVGVETVRAFVNGVVVAESRGGVAPAAQPAPNSGTLHVFDDPDRPNADVYYRLRELRVTNGHRDQHAYAADAERLSLR